MHDVAIALIAGLTGLSLGLVVGCCLMRSRARHQVVILELIRRSRPTAQEARCN